MTEPAIALGQFSGALFALSQACLFLALVVRPSRFRWSFFLPIAAITYVIIFTSTGIPPADYGVGSVMFHQVFTASDYILITDVQRELRLVGQREPISHLPFKSRFKWALNLFLSPRGVGWTHEPTSTLRLQPTPTSRSSFVTFQIFWIVFYAIIFDLATAYNMCNPSFSMGGPSLAADGWFWRSLNIFGFAVPAYTQINIMFCLVSAVAVAIGISDPQDWRYLFGSWKDVCTLRGFWGQGWHQYMRRIMSVHGKFVAHRLLRLKQGGFPSSSVQLYTAFFISGIIHTMGEYMMLRHWHGHAMKFFLLQAIAITFEDAVIALAKKMGLANRTASAFSGYIWVWMWFTWSVPILVDPLISAGLLQKGVTVNVTWGILRGDWTPEWSTTQSV